MVRKLTPSEQLTHTTVRLRVTNKFGEPFTGTGFLYSCLDDGSTGFPVIVTNRHVIRDMTSGSFHLTTTDEHGDAHHGSYEEIKIDRFADQWIGHPDQSVDLVAMPVGGLLNEAKSKGTPFFYRTLNAALLPAEEDIEDLGAIEDVVMIGYPTGLWDKANNMPIVRRGVTATHPRLDYEGRPEFLIDAACFPGSSGSPVFLYNANGWRTRAGNMQLGGFRVKLLGILYAGPQYTATGEVRVVTVPTAQRVITNSAIPINLGYVIKSSQIRAFDDLLRPAVSAASRN